MNSRVGRLGGHSHDSRNLTFLFRSREATTHRVYLNEVDTPLEFIYGSDQRHTDSIPQRAKQNGEWGSTADRSRAHSTGQITC